eukprot:1193488-Prorocentrum_minimum.AAC.1
MENRVQGGRNGTQSPETLFRCRPLVASPVSRGRAKSVQTAEGTVIVVQHGGAVQYNAVQYNTYKCRASQFRGNKGSMTHDPLRWVAEPSYHVGVVPQMYVLKSGASLRAKPAWASAWSSSQHLRSTECDSRTQPSYSSPARLNSPSAASDGTFGSTVNRAGSARAPTGGCTTQCEVESCETEKR